MGRRVRTLPTRRRAEKIHRSVRHQTTQAKVAHMVRAPTSTMGRQAPQAGSDPSHLTTTTANQTHTQATNATRSAKATVLIRLPKTSSARFHHARARSAMAAATATQASPRTGVSAWPRVGSCIRPIDAKRKMPMKPTREARR